MMYVILTIQTILEVLIAVLILIVLMMISSFIFNTIDLYYNNWKTKKCQQKAEKAFGEYLQRVHRKELRKKEMEEYPLFFWRKTCVKDMVKISKHPGIDKWR